VVNQLGIKFLEKNFESPEEDFNSWFAVDNEQNLIGFIVTSKPEDNHVVVPIEKARFELKEGKKRVYVDDEGDELGKVNNDEINKYNGSFYVDYLCSDGSIRGAGVGQMLLLYAMTYLSGTKYDDKYAMLEVAQVRLKYTDKMYKKYYGSRKRKRNDFEMTNFGQSNIVCFYNTFFGFQLAFPPDLLSYKDKQNKDIGQDYIKKMMKEKQNEFFLRHAYTDLSYAKTSKNIQVPDILQLNLRGSFKRLMARKYPTLEQLEDILDNRILSKNKRSMSCGQYLRAQPRSRSLARSRSPARSKPRRRSRRIASQRRPQRRPQRS
jgi:ribosomal protein S18 acetylase RimI-like enzyme